MLKKLFFIFCFFFTACTSSDIPKKNMDLDTCSESKARYQIIYLNGTSSAGKTTLAKALQKHLDQPFLVIGIDKVIDLMPEKLNDWFGGEAPQGFSWKAGVDETGHPIHELQMGPFAHKMSESLYQIVLTLAKMDHFIIIDDVGTKSNVDRWHEVLKDYNVLWIGVKTPLEVIEEREKARGDRMIGSARSFYFKLHNGITYDLEIDTSKETTEAIVQKIQDRLCPKKSNHNPI